MATSNYSWNLPTVGGSEDTWGTQLNANWTALDTLLGGVSQTEFAKLNGLTATTEQLNNPFPSGGIIMWSGSIASIPSGWFLCDGSNGTPNLRDRFVVGAGSAYAVGATGGADSVTLSTSQIPGHTHTFSGSTTTNGDHNHVEQYHFTNGTGDGPYGPGASCCGGSSRVSALTTLNAGDHSHTFSGTTASTGSGASHENRPPYYALAYIMKA